MAQLQLAFIALICISIGTHLWCGTQWAAAAAWAPPCSIARRKRLVHRTTSLFSTLTDLAKNGPLNEETADRIESDGTALNIMLDRVTDELRKLSEEDRDKIDAFIELIWMLRDKSKTFAKRQAKPKSPVRVENIDFRVKEQGLLYSYDLDQFKAKVLNLFDWHVSDTLADEYLAPYFPLVQSSGMGKTKLMQALRESVVKQQDERFADISCRTVVCVNGASPLLKIGESEVFSDQLRVPRYPKEEERDNIIKCLNAIMDKCNGKKVVLLFDESQHLLDSDGFYFRVVRWWLKLKKHKEKQVVAVFAGTTSRLSIYFSDPPESTFSRDVEPQFYRGSGTKLYEPFFELNTISAFALKPHQQEALTDYDRAIPYGRPLFAVMKEQGTLNDETRYSIMSRMLLGEDSDWFNNLKSCLSVLGSRMQMGQTSIQLASDLVAKSYALLTQYESGTNMDFSDVARICFPLDPTCAHLAMCIMDKDWMLSGTANVTKIQGKPKTFWTVKMSEIFSSGLCIPPKGDLGEISTAAYLLFCGDVGRKHIDKRYTTFSVPLQQYLQLLLKPDAPISSILQDEDQSHPSRIFSNASISFIQVVRNYFHYTLEELSDQVFLHDMYQSGCAFYFYPGFKTYDLMASIRLIKKNGQHHYVPLLVSISTSMEQRDMLSGDWINTTTWDTSGLFGFRLRFLFNSPTKNEIRKAGQDIMLQPNDVNELLCGRSVVKAFVMPNKDTFGVSQVVDTIRASAEKGDIYTSHMFAGSHDPEKKNSTTYLSGRASAKKPNAKSLGLLRKDYWAIRKSGSK